jgi:two-component system, OmpR family, response regulator QseB
MMRILLVEDNQIVGDGIKTGLEAMHYTVDWVQDGLQASHAIEQEHFAAIILDLGLPKRSGFDVLKRMRAHKNNTPVLILTARDTIDDRIKGLDSGADNYLIKPIELEELTARIRAITRRVANRNQNNIIINEVELNPESFAVSIKGTPLDISRREFSLLHLLMQKRNHVVSREILAQSLYGWGDEIESNAIEVHIHNLRKKLGDYLIIKTVRGVGYTIKDATA